MPVMSGYWRRLQPYHAGGLLYCGPRLARPTTSLDRNHSPVRPIRPTQTCPPRDALVTDHDAPPGPWRLFRLWAGIGFQSFGGGASTQFLIQ